MVDSVNDSLRPERETVDRSRECDRAGTAPPAPESSCLDLFECLGSGVAVYRAEDGGRKFVFVDINEAGEKIEKIRKRDVLGKWICEIFPGLENFGLLDVLKRVYRTGHAERFPASFYQDGRIAGWRESQVYRLPSGEIVVVFDDVTARKLAESRLKESEERFRAMFETAADAILLLDENGFLDCNSAALEMLGLDCKQALLELPLSAISPADRPAGVGSRSTFQEHVADAMITGSKRINSVFRHVTGGSFHAEVFLTCFRLHERQIVQATVRDITYRIQSEEALRKERDFNRQLVQRSPTFFAAFTRDGRTMMMNEVMLSSLGYGIEEVIGKDYVQSFVHPSDRKKVHAAFETQLKTPELTVIEHRIMGRNGKEVLVEWHGRSVFRGDGELEFAFAVGIDITQRRRAEAQAARQQAQLIQADKLASLGILVSGIAHEINNPNQAIMLGAGLVGKAWDSVVPILDAYFEEKGDFEVAGIGFSEMRELVPKYCSGVKECAGRIERIVSDLKEFVRRDPVDRRALVDVNGVVGSSMNLVANMVKRSTNLAEVDLAPGLPKVNGNFQRIEQVLINLIQNACQALPDKNRAIRISSAYDKGSNSVQIEVSDEGVGIPQEHLSKIRDPFFTTKRESGGTGLGLSVSTTIVAEHGGVLDFAARPGGGTTATIKLPVAGQEIKE